MFSMLFIGFSTIALGLNIFLGYTDNPWFDGICILVSLVFCVIGSISFVKRQQISQKQDFVIKEVISALGLDQNTSIQDIRLKIDLIKQKTTKYKNEKSSLISKIKLISKNYQTMLRLIKYLRAADDEQSQLIKAIKDGITIDYDKTKHILNEVGSYKTHYDKIDEKKLTYDAKAAIIIKNPLEAFLLKLYLLEYGVSADILEHASVRFDCFDVVFVDEDMIDTAPSNAVLIGSNYQKDKTYLKDISSKTELQNILKTLLFNKQSNPKTQNAFSVLIFRKNEFNNKIMLKMSDSCTSGNTYVESITALINKMQKGYKIIIIEYDAIIHDFERVTNEIYALKSKFIHTKIILLAGQNHKSLEFDFADIIIKDDMSQGDFIKMIRENL